MTCVAGTVCSAQMCFQVEDLEDQRNAIAFAVNLSVYKTIVYSTPTVVSQHHVFIVRFIKKYLVLLYILPYRTFFSVIWYTEFAWDCFALA